MAAKYHKKYRKVVKEANDLLGNPGQSEFTHSLALVWLLAVMFGQHQIS
jgi:hypothetical protein